jgi:hypothetical protein
MIDQANAAAEFKQPDRDHKDRNPDPADSTHSAAIPE